MYRNGERIIISIVSYVKQESASEFNSEVITCQIDNREAKILR